MQTELELLQPQLVVAAAENEKMLIVIERESKDVANKSEKVRGEEALANEQAAASQALKEECEADLAEAIPALNAALAALDTLKVILLLYCRLQFAVVYINVQMSSSHLFSFFRALTLLLKRQDGY